VRSLAVPGEAKAQKNPVPASDAVIAQALAHFADHCASCHANDGSGQTELGRRLYPRTPDLREPATQGLSDGELFYFIENGIRFTGMPGFGGGDPTHEAESWGLVHFIRHLPRLTPEQKADMERLNPRSAEEWRELLEDDAFLGDADPGAETTQHDHH
jgi:mono/diheme cytochrome c family protein